MLLTFIEAANFLSFRTFRLALDRRNVIVGPNGAGKSNVFRCIDLAAKALAVAHDSTPATYAWLDEYATAANRRSGAQEFEVRIGVQLTEKWERDLILLWVRAAILTNLLGSRSEPVVPINADRQVEKLVTSAKMRPLTSGALVVRYEPGPRPWSLGWAFESHSNLYTYGLAGAANSGIVQGDLPPAAQQSPSGRPLLTRLLPGDEKNGRPAGSGDVDHFDLSMLLPDPGEYMNIAAQPIPQQGGTPILNAFAQHFPSPNNNRLFTLASPLHQILSQSLVILSDRRGLPKIHYSGDDLGRPPLLTDGSEVPEALRSLQGGDPSQRREFGRVRALFTRLTGERIEIRHAPIVTPPQDPLTGAMKLAPEGMFRVEPVVVETNIDIPVQFAGAGIWEALVLSTMSVDRRGKVLLLDEPASHLHPTLQASFVRELADARMQSLLITHSAYLVPHQDEADLESVVRIVRRDGQSEVRRLPTPDQEEAVLPRSRWLQILRRADMRAALFANGVVLVEGASDFAALTIWWPKSSTSRRKGSPSERNIVVLEAEGEAGFNALTQYLDYFAVPWTIVCDGKAISPSTTNSLRRRLTNIDMTGAPPVDAKFDRWRKWWEMRGAFTLAAAADDEIENFFALIDAERWANARRKERGASKPRKARAFAEMTPCPAAADRLYAGALRRFGTTP